MAEEQRRRLHEIVDRLPEHELPLARQLLELLATGRVSGPGPGSDNPPPDGIRQPADEPDLVAEVPDSEVSPEVAAKLATLTDDELLHLHELLENDRDAARQFWRERFGEELAEDQL